jgi:hypothetical protein
MLSGVTLVLYLSEICVEKYGCVILSLEKTYESGYLAAAFGNALIQRRYESSKQMKGACNYCNKGPQIYKCFYPPTVYRHIVTPQIHYFLCVLRHARFSFVTAGQAYVPFFLVITVCLVLLCSFTFN